MVTIINRHPNTLFFLRSLFFELIMLALASTGAWCQSLQKEFELEYQFGFLNAATHQPGVVDNFGFDIGGLSHDHTFRIGYYQQILPFFDRRLFIDAGADLAYSNGGFVSDQIPPTNENFTLTYISTSVRLKAGLDYPISNFDARFAGWLDIPLSRSLDEKLISSSGTQVIASNAEIEYRPVPFGVRLEALYSKPFIPSLPITPALFAEYDISASRQAGIANPFVNALSIGLSLKWPFGGEEKAKPVDSVIKLNSVSTAPIHAEVFFTERGRRISSGEAIPIEPSDTLIKQYVMLPSWVTLSSDGKRLSKEYIELSEGESRKFDQDSLTRLDEHAIDRHLLNIFAMRLRTTDGSKITLVASGSDSVIARSISNYLEQVVRIPRHQIQIEIVPAQEGSIEILCSPQSILDPVITQWIERRYSLGAIGLDRSIEANKGVRSWQIILTQDGDTIAHFGKNSDSTQGLALMLRGLSAHNSSEIVAGMTVEDSGGSSARVMDTLRLSVINGATPSGLIPFKTCFVLLADSSQDKTADKLIKKIADLSNTNNLRIEAYFENCNNPEGAKLKNKLLSGPLRDMIISKHDNADFNGSSDLSGPRAILIVTEH